MLVFALDNVVYAMGISDVRKVCLFSKREGEMKLDGVTVFNARMVRSVNSTKDEVDETSMDDSGRFIFDAKFARTIGESLPQEFTAKQVMWVHYKVQEYKIWSGVKCKPEENIESRGKSLVVECKLNSEKNVIEVNDSPIISLCKWNVEPDETLDFEKMMQLVG